MAFDVPERARVTAGPFASSIMDGNNGAFLLPSPVAGWVLWCLASDSTEPDAAGYAPWEHVSVSARRPAALQKSRTPTWLEMCAVKEAFWGAEDAVIQFHPRRSQYVNQHPHCLHLWRPVGVTLPEPPAIFVGERS